MNLFKFKAVNNNGKNLKGSEYHENEEALSLKLRERGFYLIKCRKIKYIDTLKYFSKINFRDISVFSRQMSAMLRAGFNISEALNIFSKESYNKALKNNIKHIKDNLERGNSLYDSMYKYRESYPNFYLEMINLGEQSGTLDIILDSMAKYYINEFKIKRSFKSAMIYPSILLITSIAIFFYLEINIIPMFKNTFNELGEELPVYSMILMNFSEFIIRNKLSIIFLLLTLAFFVYKIIKLERVRLHIDKAKIIAPVLGDFYKKIIALRFTKAFSIMQKSGMDLINSIEIISRVIDNVYVKKELNKVLEEIKKGKGIAESIGDLNLFPQFTVSMISLGEQAGNLDDMSLLAANIYENDIENVLSKFISSIEPAMIVILSFIVGTVVISVMMPMLKIMQSI